MAQPSILQVVQPDDGGAVEHVLQLARGLHERGFGVEVAASPGNRSLPEIESAGVVVHRMEMKREPGVADVAAARRLRALDRVRRYDLVHAHSSKAGALVRAVLPRRRRLIYTPHCFAFAAGFSRGRRLLYRAIEQILVPRSRAIVAVCHWEYELGRDSLVGAGGRLRMIHNGVGRCPGGEPPDELLRFKDGEPLAGAITGLRPQKDPLLAIRAMARIADRGGAPGRLVVVGNGELEGAVVDEIARLGLEDRVRWLPFEGGAARYLDALDVFVLPSAWEAFPLSILEAMSCSVPVVATAVGGVPEAVADGVTGRLVPAGDVEALAAALSDLLTSEDERRSLGAAGRAEHERRFDVERMIDETAELYRGVLAA